MQNYFLRANVVITHGGPSSFMEVIKLKKVPIVVPRQEKYGEHVNNHQLVFCKELEKRKFPLILIDDVSLLKNSILNLMQNESEIAFDFNNDSFCDELEKDISLIF